MIKIFVLALAALVAFVVLALIGAFALERYNRAQDPKRFPPPGRMVDIGGRRLHIRCEGQGGPTVVLEMGGGIPSLMQYPLLERIARFTRVCAYDRAGLGWSDDGPRGQSFTQYAADLRTLLANAGEHGPIVIVGESWGGMLAQAYAHAYPQDVAGLVLVDAAETQQMRQILQPLAEGWKRQGSMLSVLTELGLVRYGTPRRPAFSPGLTDAQRHILAALMSRPSIYRTMMDGVAQYQQMPAGGYGALGSLPLVVIRHGGRFVGPNSLAESGWPAAQARLAALSSDSTTIVAKDNGHMIAEENPDLVAEAVRTLLMRVRAGN